MLDLALFVGVARRALSPSVRLVYYMHENQWTYVAAPTGAKTGAFRRAASDDSREREELAMRQFHSMLAADAVCFNSQFHLDEWFGALPKLLRRARDFQQLGAVPAMRAKSRVLHVGVDLIGRLGTCAPEDVAVAGEPPLVLWNMRWCVRSHSLVCGRATDARKRREYDKNPRSFFDVLKRMAESGVAFRLAVCGERSAFTNSEFEALLESLRDCTIHVGFADDDQYRSLLWQADVTISTALHEFFGVAVVEAGACETFPLLPRRLAYPEVIEERFHADILYFNEKHLEHRLRWALAPENAAKRRAVASALAASLRAAYDWSSSTIAKAYADALSL